MSTHLRWLVPPVVLALYGVPALASPQLLRALIEILYLGLFAVAYNLLFGYAGLLSFGFNACFGVGAYAYAIVAGLQPGGGILLPALVALCCGSIAGAVTGALCTRLQGGYFSLLTLAFSQFFLAIAIKWRSVTHGEDGAIVPPPALHLPGAGTIRLDIDSNLFWFTLTVVALCLWLMWRLTRTSAGFAVVLVRENPERAEFLGYNVYLVKIAVFTLASIFATVAGILFALFQRLVSPSVFGLGQAADILFMTVLGGSGSFLGPLAGAVIYQFTQDWLSRTTEHWQLFIGLLFVGLVLFAPGGLTQVLRGILARPSPAGGVR